MIHKVLEVLIVLALHKSSSILPSLHSVDLRPFQVDRVQWQCGYSELQHEVQLGSSCPQCQD